MRVISSHSQNHSNAFIPVKATGGLAGYLGNFGYGTRDDNNYFKLGSSFDQASQGQIKSQKQNQALMRQNLKYINT
jgi:hypothetical protein